MTIKQVVFGVIVGTSVVGLMVHRLKQEREMQNRPHVVASSDVTPAKAEPPKTAFISIKRRHSGKKNGNSDIELSSTKLY